MQIADHTEVAVLEDRSVLILVDRKDVLRVLHSDLVLNRAGDSERQVEVGGNRLTGLPDLSRVRIPTGIDHGAGSRNGSAHGIGKGLGYREVLLAAEASPATDQDLGVLDVYVLASLLAALDHAGLGGPLGELDIHVDYFGGTAGLVDIERVDPADDHTRVTDITDLGDLGVTQNRAVSYELAVLGLYRGDLHGHTGVEAGGQAGTDLEAE